MSIIIAFFCGICFSVLADSVADYISACAQKIEAQAEALRLENKSKALELDKIKKTDTAEPQE